MGKYSLLLWDIDGTVLDFKAAESAAIRTLFGKFGFGECSDASIARYSDINRKYWQALERGEMTKPEILVGRFREFFGEMGLDVSAAEDFNRDYQLALGDTIVFCENALALLRSEKGRYTLAAITNGTRRAQEKKLTRSGLNQVFDYIFISEEVGAEKPAEAFFDEVFRATGVSDKASALVIGDSLTSDILGGNRYGLDTCWYNPNGEVCRPDIRPTYEIRHLDEVEEILNR